MNKPTRLFFSSFFLERSTGVGHSESHTPFRNKLPRADELLPPHRRIFDVGGCVQRSFVDGKSLRTWMILGVNQVTYVESWQRQSSHTSMYSC